MAQGKDGSWRYNLALSPKEGKNIIIFSEEYNLTILETIRKAFKLLRQVANVYKKGNYLAEVNAETGKLTEWVFPDFHNSGNALFHEPPKSFQDLEIL